MRARELAAKREALLMTPDAWMISLFGHSQWLDPPRARVGVKIAM
jgi:hypothetical protein